MGSPHRSSHLAEASDKGTPFPRSCLYYVCKACRLCYVMRNKRKASMGLRWGEKWTQLLTCFFADNSLLFVRATDVEVENVKELQPKKWPPDINWIWISQKCRLAKTLIQIKKKKLQMKLTFEVIDEHDKYLGLPTYVGSSKKRIFHTIQDRIWKKLKGWKEKYLSQAG